MECQKSTIAVIATATTIAMAKTIFLIIGARSAPAGRSYTPTFRVGGRGALSIESSTIAGGAPVAGRPPAFGSRCDHARRLAAVTEMGSIRLVVLASRFEASVALIDFDFGMPNRVTGRFGAFAHLLADHH